MKGKILLMTLLVLLFVTGYALAAEEQDQRAQKDLMIEHIKEEASSAVEVNNTICPVSGEEIGKMGPVTQFEYEGKIYNFCCAGCVEEFKKDPEQYVEIIEEQKDQNREIGEE